MKLKKKECWVGWQELLPSPTLEKLSKKLDTLKDYSILFQHIMLKFSESTKFAKFFQYHLLDALCIASSAIYVHVMIMRLNM